MFKTSLYTILVTLLLSLHPIIAGGAPQHTDITKPTRERVSQKDKNKDNNKDKKADNKKDEKKDDKKTAKPAAQTPVPQKENNVAKPAVAKDVKPAAPKRDSDSVAKADKPKPKVRQTFNADNALFDGIDVSKHQGYIDWAQLKNNTKIKFVYIKATEGTDYVDPRYKENIRNARKHGFKVGSYHYLTTKSSATTQFHNFIRTANREEQDLLPVIDVEVIGRWSSQQLRDSLKVFADLVEDYYGCKPLIYTSEKFFTKHLGRAFADYPLFIAKYSNAQPNIGYKWIIWQFSDYGLFKTGVKGNNGLVDLSRFNKGCTVNDIIYKPGKHKPKSSVHDAVDRKDKPSSVNLTEQKTKETPKMSKRQQEEAQKQAEKDKKTRERNKKIAEDEAKKKEEEAKKAKEKQEHLKKEKARQEAREAAAKREAEQKAKEKEERLKKEKARQQAREAAAKKEAEEKAKRKANAQKARQEKANSQKNKSNKSNKSASLLNSSSSKLSQSQRNDSIRASQYNGRKTNKSSADND